MAVDTALRPVLVELGASVPSRGLYFEMSQMDRMDEVVDGWAEQNLTIIERVLAR
jgi:FMN reductase